MFFRRVLVMPAKGFGEIVGIVETNPASHFGNREPAGFQEFAGPLHLFGIQQFDR